MPPATTTTWPVTWPERVSEARTTTCAATSSAVATLRSGMVRVIRSTLASSRRPRVIGDVVHPGATAFTRAVLEIRATSFFTDSSRPPRIADLAAA